MRAPSPATPIGVLMVDDSAVMRAILRRTLDPCPDIAIIGQAPSAARALAMLDELRPDLILLDVEMPDGDGVAALPDIIARSHGAPVLVVSSACIDGGAATLRALRAGAADTLPKPDGLSFAGAFAERLAERIRSLARPHPTAGPPPPRAGALPILAPAVVGIAASTGGVHALGRLLAALPRSFTAPLLVTQHLPEPFMPHFARQLAGATGRRTRVAENGMRLHDGEMLVAPGDAHLALARTGPLIHVRLENGKAASGCRPSADPMFASLATIYGADACGVVLSGMGRDGVEGAAQLAAVGAPVLVQDADSSVIWGMPGRVAQAGHARAVATPEGIAAMLAGEGAAWS